MLAATGKAKWKSRLTVPKSGLCAATGHDGAPKGISRRFSSGRRRPSTTR